MTDSGLRHRKKKSGKHFDTRAGGDSPATPSPKADSNEGISLLRVGIIVGGLIIMLKVSHDYAVYISQLHENRMYFNGIQEVEREISFRTESGLYYSYYKQLVHAPSLSEGMHSLMSDNLTEFTTQMNVLARMNIYQEVLLGILYRTSTTISKSLPPIFFYLYSIHGLQMVLVSALFVLAWALAGTPLAGLLTVACYVFNKDDTTRSIHSAPLRENFSLPFLWVQLAAIAFYFRPKQHAIAQKVSVAMIFVGTFLFAVTWQFNQFILLLQSMSLFGVQVLQLVPHRKVLMVYAAQLVALLLVCLLQFFNTMILTGPLFCFVPAAIIVMKIQGERPSGSPVVVRALNVLWYIVLVLALMFGFGFLAKMICADDSDAHIFRFILIKFGMAKESWDFDVKLYLCNGAFGFIEPFVIQRLRASFLLPIYAVFQLGLLVTMAIALFQKWGAERLQAQSEGKKPDSPNDTHILSSRPELAYHGIQAVLFGMLAVTVVRMKYLWTPYMCVMASLCIGDTQIWKYIGKKLQANNYIVYTMQSLALIGCIAMLWHWYVPVYQTEMKTLQEFYDPDTVELMDWIKKSTPAASVFTGSMQLLAGVKLCTLRAITNHPHYEDTQLRYRTKALYQMYARTEPAKVHAILARFGATHAILEDSICLARKDDGCGTPSIMDMVNGELPDGWKEGAGLVHSAKPRFCNEVRYGRGEYTKYFKEVFKNRTFRVYALL